MKRAKSTVDKDEAGNVKHSRLSSMAENEDDSSDSSDTEVMDGANKQGNSNNTDEGEGNENEELDALAPLPLADAETSSNSSSTDEQELNSDDEPEEECLICTVSYPRRQSIHEFWMGYKNCIHSICGECYLRCELTTITTLNEGQTHASAGKAKCPLCRTESPFEYDVLSKKYDEYWDYEIGKLNKRIVAEKESFELFKARIEQVAAVSAEKVELQEQLEGFKDTTERIGELLKQKMKILYDRKIEIRIVIAKIKDFHETLSRQMQEEFEELEHPEPEPENVESIILMVEDTEEANQNGQQFIDVITIDPSTPIVLYALVD